MQSICDEAFEKNSKITRAMWRKLQMSLPKTRLFDARFVIGQKKLLENLKRNDGEKKIEVG